MVKPAADAPQSDQLQHEAQPPGAGPCVCAGGSACFSIPCGTRCSVSVILVLRACTPPNARPPCAHAHGNRRAKAAQAHNILQSAYSRLRGSRSVGRHEAHILKVAWLCTLNVLGCRLLSISIYRGGRHCSEALICACVYQYALHISIPAYMYQYAHEYMYARIYIYINTCMNICMLAYIYQYVHEYMYARIYILIRA